LPKWGPMPANKKGCECYVRRHASSVQGFLDAYGGQALACRPLAALHDVLGCPVRVPSITPRSEPLMQSHPGLADVI
jgi:hypothetical protein